MSKSINHKSRNGGNFVDFLKEGLHEDVVSRAEKEIVDGQGGAEKFAAGTFRALLG